MMRHAVLVAATSALTVLTAGPVHAAPPVRVAVDQGCVAPAPGTSNYCAVRGVLPGAGVDGTDVTWEVVLLRDATAWRVQAQAFSETGQECVYPMRVRGSVRAPYARPDRFVTSGAYVSSADGAAPVVELAVVDLRIRLSPTC